MGKGWNMHRCWNNGWGANRKNRNGTWDLTWVNHSTIETEKRVQNVPIEEPRKAIGSPVQVEIEKIGMDQPNAETIQVNKQI